MPKKRKINPLRLDPTRTTTAASLFAADISRRLRQLNKAIYQLVAVEDAFGLRADAMAAKKAVGGGALVSPSRVIPVEAVLNTTGPVINQRWRFETDAGKVQGYQKWLGEQVKAGILEVDPINQQTPWLQKYIKSTYKKGMMRAYTDVGKNVAGDMSFIEGGKKAFLDMAFNAPVAQSKIEMLGTRAFTQLKGITTQMDQEMSRVLGTAIAQGKGADATARELMKTVSGLDKARSKRIARTELVHTHNEGQLDAFEAMNIEEVGVLAEWSTAHDDLVCPLCQPLEGIILTIKEARGLLPRHPNCRCAWIPAGVGEHRGGTTSTTHAGKGQGLEAPGTAPTGKTTGQTFSKDIIAFRMRESIKAEHPKLGIKEARKASRWVGADVKVTGKLKPGSKAYKAEKAAAKTAAAQAAQAASTKAAEAKAAQAAAQKEKVLADVAEQKEVSTKVHSISFSGSDGWKADDFKEFRLATQADIDPTLDKALHKYMMEPEKGKRGYAEVNADLRKGVDLTDDEIAGPLLRYYGEAPGTPTYELAEETLLHRGMGFDLDDPLLAKLLTPGEVISDPAFLSTTLRKDFGEVLAQRLAKDKAEKVVLSVKTPKGTRVLMTDNDKAREVLLGPGTQFRVTNVTKGTGWKDNVYNYVEAEIITADDAAKAALNKTNMDAAAKKVKGWQTSGTTTHLDAADYSKVDGWGPPTGDKTQSYGMVLFDDQGRVLLREPKDHYGGAHWTFAKGGGNKPATTAMAELGEETGYIGGLHDIIPGEFKGTTTKTNYFVGKAKGYDGSLMDTETVATKWMTYDEAVQAISLSPDPVVVARDLKVLEAAYDTMKNSDGKLFKTLLADGAEKHKAALAAAEKAAKSHKIKMGQAQSHYAKPKFGGGVVDEDWVNPAVKGKLKPSGLDKVLSEKGWHTTTLPKETADALNLADDVVAQKAIMDGLKKAPKGTPKPPAALAPDVPEPPAYLLTGEELANASGSQGQVLKKALLKGSDKDIKQITEALDDWGDQAKLFGMNADEAADYINKFKAAHPHLYKGVVPDVPDYFVTAEFIEKAEGTTLTKMKKAIGKGSDIPEDDLIKTFDQWGESANLFKGDLEAAAEYLNEFKAAHPHLYKKAVKTVSVDLPPNTKVTLADFDNKEKPSHQDMDKALLKGTDFDYDTVYPMFKGWTDTSKMPGMTAQQKADLFNEFKAAHPHLYKKAAPAPAPPVAPTKVTTVEQAADVLGYNVPDLDVPNATVGGFKDSYNIPAEHVAKAKTKTGKVAPGNKYTFTEEGLVAYAKNWDIDLTDEQVKTILKAKKPKYIPLGAQLEKVHKLVADTLIEKANKPLVPKPIKVALPREGDLTKVKDLPGSTKPYLAKDKDGGKWVVKDVSGSGIDPNHLRSEMLADDLYRLLGYDVPKGGIVESAGGPMKVTEFLDGGQTLAAWRSGKTAAEIADMNKQIQRGFVVDALFANHDVAGLSADNIFVVAGKAYRIDNGGALTYRAQGAAKRTWGPKVTELESMRDPGINGVTAEIYRGITDAEIHRQIRHIQANRDALLAAIPDADVRAVMAARIDDLTAKLPATPKPTTAPAGVRRAEYGITTQTANRAKAAKSNGVTVAADKDLIEDNNILVWEELDAAGNPVTKMQFKVTPKGSKTIETELGAELQAAKAVAPVTEVNVHPDDVYWGEILKGIKTVNYHAADGQYNEATLTGLKNIRKGIAESLKTAKGDKKKMLSHYAKAIDEINKAKAAGKTTPVLTQYEYKPKPTKKEPRKPRRDYTVRRDSGINFRTVRFENGVSREATGMNRFSSKEVYVIDAGDGVDIKFLPNDGRYERESGRALHGTVTVTVRGGGEEGLNKAKRIVDDLGVDITPSQEYEEMMYLHRGVYLRGKHNTPTYEKLWADTDMPLPEKITAMKAYVKKEMGIDVDKRPNYDPHGISKHADGSGFRHWERWDLSAEEVANEMSGYSLVHTAGGSLGDTPRGVTADVLGKILDSGGEFTTTAGRIRKGVPVNATGGASSSADMNTGGASYFFTRISKDTNTANGFNFRIGALSRQDAITYDSDRFGAIADIRDRGRTIDDYKAFANRRSNETIFKEGLSIDDIDFIRVRDTEEKDQVIKVFHARGMFNLPDGRSVEDIVVTGKQKPKARKTK